MPAADEEREGRRFDSMAANYEAEMAQTPVRKQVRDRVIEIVAGEQRKLVIDLGCGTGTVLTAVASRIEKGIGFDVSTEMLAIAKQTASSQEHAHLDFRRGSFLDSISASFLPDGSASKPDVIMATYSLHHLPTDQKREVIAGCGKRLCNGGLLLIGDLMFFETPDKHREDFDIVGYSPINDRPDTTTALEQMCVDAGLSVEFERLHPLAGILVASRQR